MEQALLRKVQLTQLEIALEIRRVCEENDIPYFLDAGTFLGAVRHGGFIPWDDDMDMGMLRPDYERFCRIAPEKLKPQYCFVSWYTDPAYSLPFGKVMKRNTLFMESKKSRRLQENGFYVDIFPYDVVPDDADARRALAGSLLTVYRTKLMRSGYRPWMEEDRINWKKRIGYLYYQCKALGQHDTDLARRYDALATACKDGAFVTEQEAQAKPKYFEKTVMEELTDYSFEGHSFKGVRDYDRFLTVMYGDYMTLPPEDQRENRHQIREIDFGAE